MSDKIQRLFITFIIFLLIICIVLLCICFILDNPEINIVDGTYENIVVEYGKEVPKNNVKAIYLSKIFHKKGIEVPVVVDDISVTKIGPYTVNFHVNYKGAAKSGYYIVEVVDTVSPILDVDEETLEYTCIDNYDGDITEQVDKIIEPDRYIFTALDSSGNYAEFIVYRDNDPPHITLGKGLLDFECIDNVDGDLTNKVTYYESEGYMFYTVSDSSGNVAEVNQKIGNGNKVVYLTFDDGPSAYTSDLLDILKKYNVKATFFIVGTSRYLSILPRMEEEGHKVAAHTYNHEYSQCYSSVDAYFEDLDKVQSKIEEQIGHRTELIRFPGGSSNTVSKKYCSGIMTELSTEVENRGYTYFDWNVSSGDAGETTETNVVVSNVKSGIESCNVAVVLQHDVKSYSVAGVEEIIKWGLDKGYVFLPLTEKSFAAHHKINN